MSLLIPLALLILSIPLVLALVRANELFLLRVRQGKLRVARGRLPQRLLDDILDIVRDAAVEDAEIRAASEGGRAVIYVQGQDLPRHVRQRLRNVISLWPVAKIRQAPKPR